MGAKLEITSELLNELENMRNVDLEQFKSYKTTQAVLDKGFYDMESQKNIRPNIHTFLSIISTVL
jgi:hypothetical protein